ncbi:MAG: ATP-grasp domain-containing protein [Acidimicrobiales bacterium]|nr:ATP-grasp domain-containing protein [Acidimicrobiales bacterium]
MSESAVTALRPAAPVTVLISSAGRRVELLRGFRRALGALGLDGRVIATDASWYSSAFHDADEGILVPRLDSDDFVPTMLELCEKQRVDLVVPTIDTEMAAWVAGRERLAALGTTVALSSAGVVDIAADKQLTHEWLVANDVPTVAQATPEAVLADPGAWPFPLVVKPRFGSAGIGVGVVRDTAELAMAVSRPELGEMVVQTLAPGREHTIDVLADRDGNCVCAVPRRRIEVRAGEVSKAVTVRSPELQQLAARICAALPGAFGTITVQLFVGDEPGQLAVIEINARYGGGFPLALEAGADFPRWQLEELLGLPSSASPDGWRDGLVMLRYDAAVFVDDRQAP